MLRTILALVAGVVTAMLTIMVCEYVSHALHPLPAGVSSSDMQAMAAYAASAPPAALGLVLFGWTLGAFDGALVAALVAPARARLLAMVVGAVVVLGVVANAMMLPQPPWMTAPGVLLPLAAAHAAWLLARQLRPRRSAGA